MDKKGGDTAGSSRSNLSGDTVSARILSDPPSTLDGNAEEQLDDSGAFQPSSASEKAAQLPQRTRIIVVAGLFIWIIIAIGLLIFFF
ncbi:MAG: hypothetical protein Pars92KO_32130 [Parasphingorhabdus sp.]